MSKISRTRGKNIELAIAKQLGAKRSHYEPEDLVHWLLSVEVKHRKKLPKLLLDSMAQAKKATPKDKIPCVVLHQAQMLHSDSLAIIQVKHLYKMLKAIECTQYVAKEH